MSRKRIGFMTFMNVQIEQLKSANRFGTAKNYQKCLKSFSTFLKGIPITIISAVMSHTSEQTTRIYLAMLENIVIDNANRKSGLNS